MYFSRSVDSPCFPPPERQTTIISDTGIRSEVWCVKVQYTMTCSQLTHSLRMSDEFRIHYLLLGQAQTIDFNCKIDVLSLTLQTFRSPVFGNRKQPLSKIGDTYFNTIQSSSDNKMKNYDIILLTQYTFLTKCKQ